MRLETFSGLIDSLDAASILQVTEMNRNSLEIDIREKYSKECMSFLQYQQFYEGVWMNSDFLFDTSAGIVTKQLVHISIRASQV